MQLDCICSLKPYVNHRLLIKQFVKLDSENIDIEYVGTSTLDVPIEAALTTTNIEVKPVRVPMAHFTIDPSYSSTLPPVIIQPLIFLKMVYHFFHQFFHIMDTRVLFTNKSQFNQARLESWGN